MNRQKIEFSFGGLSKKQNVLLKKEEVSSDESEDSQLNENDKYRSKVNIDILNEQQDTEDIIKQNTISPEVYDYDNYYEKKENRKEKEKKQEIDKSKPKYMNKIIKAVEKNKIERMINQEKVESLRIQKETGKKIEEIPKFITESYKNKLKELNASSIDKEEEENSVNNKEFGMMGFYANLITKNKLYSKEEEGDIKKEIEDKEIETLFQKRKKEYEKNLPEFDDTVIKKIVNRERTIEHKETSPKDNSKEDKQSLIDKYKARYLNRKKQRDNEQVN